MTAAARLDPFLGRGAPTRARGRGTGLSAATRTAHASARAACARGRMDAPPRGMAPLRERRRMPCAARQHLPCMRTLTRVILSRRAPRVVTAYCRRRTMAVSSALGSALGATGTMAADVVGVGVRQTMWSLMLRLRPRKVRMVRQLVWPAEAATSATPEEHDGSRW